MILSQEERVQRLKVKYDLLNEVHRDVLEVENALRHRILTDENSFGKVHSILNELEGFDSETVHEQTVHVIQKVMNAKEVSFLTLSEN